MPVLPEVPSMIVPPGSSLPARSASSIIFTAMRSLIELPGLKVSILASTVASTTPCVILLMRTIGVLPIASRMVSQIFFTDQSYFQWSGALPPRAEEPPHRNELADVIRVVIEHEYQLAQIRLARAVRDLREQIHLRVGGQPLQRSQIAAKRRDAGVPRRAIGRRLAARPIMFRPLRLRVLRVAAELEDVELRQSKVLEELPWRIRQPRWL